MLLNGVDAAKGTEIMAIDIHSVFIQTLMPESNQKAVMKIKGKLVDRLLEINFTAYNTCVVYEGGDENLIFSTP